MQTAKDLLIAGRAIIANPDNWTKGAYAKNKDGRTVHLTDPEATQFCSSGALSRACVGIGQEKAHQLHPIARLALCHGIKEDITKFNDEHTHAEVLEQWDKAIAACK